MSHSYFTKILIVLTAFAGMCQPDASTGSLAVVSYPHDGCAHLSKARHGGFDSSGID